MTRLRYNNAVGKLGASLGGSLVSGMAVDTSTAPWMTSSSGNVKTTAPFSPPANSLLVLLSFNFGGSAGALTGVTDSLGAHLTWVNQGASGGFNGAAHIYVASCPSAQSNMTVTATSPSGTTLDMIVLVLNGAKADQTGSAVSTASNLQTRTLTTTAPNSMVVCCGGVGGFGSSPTPSPVSGSTMTANGSLMYSSDSGTNGQAWATMTTDPAIPSGTPVTVGVSGGNGTGGGIIAREILASGGGGSYPTLITFATPPSFPTVAAPDYIPLILDPPQGSTPSPTFEVVYLVGYTAGQSTGSVSRGQEGTSPAAHANGAIWLCGQTAGDVVSTPNVQVFTGAGTYTWNKPAGISTVQVVCIGGGGGGGSGRRGAAGTVRCGGGAGGSGSYTQVQMPAAACNPTETVVVGAAGIGGAAQTTDNTDGIAASGASGTSYFGASGHGHVGAGGGTAGQGGTASSGTNGVAGGGMVGGVAGGAASTTGAAGAAGSPSGGAASGGAGGGITSADSPSNGGLGGNSYMNALAGGGAAGTVPGGNGGAGYSHPSGDPGGGAGGGGGAASITGAAGAGGLGGNYGASGGGGGASLNGNASGKGGDGGPGIVVVTAW